MIPPDFLILLVFCALAFVSEMKVGILVCYSCLSFSNKASTKVQNLIHQLALANNAIPTIKAMGRRILSYPHIFAADSTYKHLV